MASVAVFKIKEAEDQAGEAIRSANEKAKEIIRKAEEDGISKRRMIINEANEKRAALIEAAVKKAEQDSSNLTSESDKEWEAILNPDKSKFLKVVDLAAERIVK